MLMKKTLILMVAICATLGLVGCQSVPETKDINTQKKAGGMTPDGKKDEGAQAQVPEN